MLIFDLYVIAATRSFAALKTRVNKNDILTPNSSSLITSTLKLCSAVDFDSHLAGQITLCVSLIYWVQIMAKVTYLLFICHV